jgi:hypothetical protein
VCDRLIYFEKWQETYFFHQLPSRMEIITIALNTSRPTRALLPETNQYIYKFWMKRKKVSSQPASDSSLHAYQYRRLRSNRADKKIIFVSIGMESTDDGRLTRHAEFCVTSVSPTGTKDQRSKKCRDRGMHAVAPQTFSFKRPETINATTNLLLWI